MPVGGNEPVVGHDIFISYSREERAAARHFADCFAKEGLSVWWDAVLRPGQTFDEVIERELRAAKAVVVLWSPRSVASRWVRAEANLADRLEKLVPVKIAACSLPIIFELTQTTDLSEWAGDTGEAEWRALIEDIRRLVDPAGGAVEAAASPAPVNEVARKVDALIATVSSLGSDHDLSKPTPEEEEATRFFQRSDDYRRRERAAAFHVMIQLDLDGHQTRHVVPPAGLLIGRSPPADVLVDAPGVSRAHCRVDFVGGKLCVSDLNSTNGSFVDGKRVKGSAPLAPGALLRIGGAAFRYEVVGADDPAAIEPLTSTTSDNPGVRATAH
ncbi:TIR domain-containing protein [Sphingomonas sp. ASV193]|uniref:TIR domain-containing protein n=1 Tax=Sphingomonas sp. ASV193 TaxID=3144405 RepID=UPI0032E8F5EA